VNLISHWTVPGGGAFRPEPSTWALLIAASACRVGGARMRCGSSSRDPRVKPRHTTCSSR
jgi:hypothetical protein